MSCKRTKRAQAHIHTLSLSLGQGPRSRHFLSLFLSFLSLPVMVARLVGEEMGLGWVGKRGIDSLLSSIVVVALSSRSMLIY